MYNTSTLVLKLFYDMYVEDKEIELNDIALNYEVSRKTTYNLINIINLFISEFRIDNIELINNKGKISIKKNI